MLAVLSPAKSLDFECESNGFKTTTPEMIESADYLVGKLKKLSAKQIGKLMKLSDNLSQLNYDRYHSWEVPHGKNARPCIMAFRGEVYRGFDAASLSHDEVEYSQKHLRILSGLYGLLKPLDNILPYRLEMGTSFAVTPKQKNLYKYWDDRITNSLNEAVEASGSNILVNLASNEYFKSVQADKLGCDLVTCQFKDKKNGEYKALMAYAKLARGYMARYMVQNQVETIDGLKSFDSEGYSFNSKLSSEREFIFTRG